LLDSPFTIYNASAGSGKTYTLAKAYLKILLGSNNPLEFKHVLAITFTNKAVGEMKDRIVSMLKTFSSIEKDNEPHPMLKDICLELSKTEDQIKSQSKIILKNLLHNYGAFEVTTIDAFTHRLIRTFAHDLRLPLNFEVELDQERLLNEAVDKLISKAGIDQELTNTLVKFAIEKTNEDKSWDISYDLNNISGVLLKENDLYELEKIKGKTLSDFKILKRRIKKELDAAEAKLRTTASSALSLIEESGLNHDDFSSKYLPNYFLKLESGSTNINYGAKWQDNLIEGNPLYPKRVSEAVASIINEIQPQLTNAFTSSKTNLYEVKFLKSALQNLTPYSVLNLIGQELNQLKINQNVMLISEFNTIISKEIRNQPTPFIYERIGERFNHYFVDEFQDTSQLQWQNLIPLLDNTLSSGRGSSMIVGDAKQSIYRWRGSDPEQFISLYQGDNQPFHTGSKILNLATNYRSSENIVDFNNSFFTHLGHAFFSNDNHGQLYNKAGQDAYLKTKGYVRLRFLDIKKEDSRDEKYVYEVLETVSKCLSRGYDYKDICIITRKRKEGVAIAQYLSENEIPITSSETLLLKNSPKVKFLLTLLKLLLKPSANQLKIEALEFLAHRQGIEDKHEFYIRHLSENLDVFLSDLCAQDVNIKTNSLLQLSLYELVEQIIGLFELNKVSDAYLQFFLDEVLGFVQSKQSDIASFIRYFEAKEDKLSVVVSSDINAVQIMTIHKSKGLEFPIVIFPFADLDIYREMSPKLWFPVDKQRYNGFDNLLINFNKDVENYRAPGPNLYEKHRQQLVLDNINLLYVVMTRPETELYVISKRDFTSKGDTNPNTFSGLFISYLISKNLWVDSEENYSFGEQHQVKSKTPSVPSEILHLISNQKESNNLKIVTKASLLWDSSQQEAIERGNLIHLILSKINTKGDLDFAFNELKISGDINENSARLLRPLVEKVVFHPELTEYFEDDYEVFNEHDILLESGKLIRPDRINLNSKNEVTIIDYKTGSKKSHHQEQINYYDEVLNQMDFIVIKKMIIYINDSIEIIEV
jgi:ATP-dependent exoDNAse (exonuclease V) beta subunit